MYFLLSSSFFVPAVESVTLAIHSLGIHAHAWFVTFHSFQAGPFRLYSLLAYRWSVFRQTQLLQACEVAVKSSIASG